MIEEIIYTSAQKGLKAGSRGFCTVVSTAGMALNTAERLESMSGYRHAFPMQDPRAQHNPINYSHVTLRIGGKNSHVISRISNAGQDYSGRTNKLAHHLMFDDVSRFVVGPARLMAENGVLVTQWDGNVRNVPSRNLPAPAMPKSVELKAWKTATGDSGWAGWVAEQLMKDKAPVSVIFSPGTDTLALVREALDLLPPTQRWSVTFSTYFTKLLAGTECQLRFVLDDTPEATALRNDARARVVDLTKSLGAAQGGPIVEQARTGRLVFGNADIPEPRIPTRNPPQVQADRLILPASRNEMSASNSSLPEVPMLTPRAPAIPFGSQSGPPDLFEKPIRKSKRWTWVLYAGGSLFLMMIASGVTFFVMTQLDSGVRYTKTKEHGLENSTTNVDPAPQQEQETETRGDKVTTPAVELKGDSKPVANEATVELTSNEKMVAAENPAPSESKVEPVVPSELPDPFVLVLNNEEFQYPRHDLHLFRLPDNHESAEKCKIPLILQVGDTVSLSLHPAFLQLIDGRVEDGSIGLDFRLSGQPMQTEGSEWKAEVFRDGIFFDSFGVYKFRQIENAELATFGTATHGTATHIIEFEPAKFLTDPREKDVPNLFRMCPLIVVVTSRSGKSISKSFCQSIRQPHVAESRRGSWKPEFSNESNALRGLAILNGTENAPWKMHFDVMTLSHNRERIIHRFQFSEEKTTQAIGKLFSNIASVEKTESEFCSNLKGADGECGYLQHDFLWQFEKENGQTPNVAHHYSVTKNDEGVLRLPAMPDSQSGATIPKEHRISERLSKGNGAFDDTGWAKTLDLQEHPELRLRTHSTSDDKFAENSERLSGKTTQMNSTLETTLEEKNVGLKELNDAWKDKPKTADFETPFKEFTSHIGEIQLRISALKDLSKEFDPAEHEKQFKAFKASQKKENERIIGYEIAVELKEQTIDGILYPATIIYLVETIFPDEPR